MSCGVDGRLVVDGDIGIRRVVELGTEAFIEGLCTRMNIVSEVEVVKYSL